jgi:hypothetical protein
VERIKPIFMKMRFHIYWGMCLYMFTRACGFGTTVHLPILHIECAIGFTRIFQTGGLGVEAWSQFSLELIHWIVIYGDA